MEDGSRFSKQDYKWIEFCKKIATNSTHDDYKMGSVVVKGGALYSFAWNLNKWRSHAETRAIRPHNYYHGATIYVARLNGLASHPCVNCLKAIIEAGILRIVYNDEVGNLSEVYSPSLVIAVSNAKEKYL